MRNTTPIGGITAIAIALSVGGCSSSVSVTLCSAADKPVEFALRFTRADPQERAGVLPPGARTTVKVDPRGDGDYSIELRRADTVQQHPGRYYTSRGGDDSFTVKDDLSLVDGCTR